MSLQTPWNEHRTLAHTDCKQQQQKYCIKMSIFGNGFGFTQLLRWRNTQSYSWAFFSLSYFEAVGDWIHIDLECFDLRESANPWRRYSTEWFSLCIDMREKQTNSLQNSPGTTHLNTIQLLFVNLILLPLGQGALSFKRHIFEVRNTKKNRIYSPFFHTRHYMADSMIATVYSGIESFINYGLLYSINTNSWVSHIFSDP